MRCQDVQGLFSEIYDGIAAEQAILVKHLQECSTCAAEYESYCRLLNELKQLPEPEIPPNFHEIMMAKIREVASLENNAASMQELTLRKWQKTARARKPAQKAYAAARRWASVAAAACLLLVSMWAVHSFDLVPQPDMTQLGRVTYMTESLEYGIEMADGDIAVDFEPFMDDAGIPPTYDMQRNMDDFWNIDDNSEDLAGGQAAPEIDSHYGIYLDPVAFGIDAADQRLTMDLPLTNDSSDFGRAWTIAFATGFAVLAISLAAMVWNIRRKK